MIIRLPANNFAVISYSGQLLVNANRTGMLQIPSDCTVVSINIHVF